MPQVEFGIGSVITQDAGAPASATSIRDFINHDRQVQFWIRLYSLMNRIYLLQFLGCNKMKRCNKFKEKIKRGLSDEIAFLDMVKGQLISVTIG
ncbi:hypothetical protein ACS0TY_003971 [Phlomoides rotata]